jgi:hypothetical protein
MRNKMLIKIFEDSLRGTGPRCGDGEGMTASVTDIISSTEAIEPRGRGGGLPELTELSVSPFRKLGCFAVVVKVCNEFWVMALSEFFPGSFVFSCV